MHESQWRDDDTGPLDLVRTESFVEASVPGGFERKHPLPSIGSRKGSLVVRGYAIKPSGGLAGIYVACDCGAPEHIVAQSNFDKGSTTRCNTCAKIASVRTRKQYWQYADICRDDEHRRRLLNRIAAAYTRCYSPANRGYPAYGARGIRIYWYEKFGVTPTPQAARSRIWRKEMLRYIVTLDGWDQPHLEMDRIDVDGDYAPGNIRFISRRDNIRNKRKANVLSMRILELEAEVSRLRSAGSGAE